MSKLTPAQIADQKLTAMYRPGTFLHFYHGGWTQKLDAVEIPGMEGASWDRKAAWLLWLALGNPPDEVNVEESFAGKPKQITATHRVVTPAPAKQTSFEDLI